MNSIDKILSLADEYALLNRISPSDAETFAARQALEAELVRLFTPLSDEQMDAICIEAGNQLRSYCAGSRDEKPLSVGRLVEQAHGIGGES